MESRSFASDKKLALMRRNEQILLTRYPYHNDLVYKYNNFNIEPADWFSDLLFGPLKPSKALILVSPNTTQSEAGGLIRELANVSQNDIEITIASTKDKVLAYFKNSEFRLINTYNISELFHVGFMPFTEAEIKDLIVLNERCVRIIAKAKDPEHKQYISPYDKSAHLGPSLMTELKLTKKIDLKKLKQRWIYFNDQAKRLESKKSFSRSVKLRIKTKLNNKPKLYNATRSAYRRIRR
jgi:hypothetical protein